MEKFINRIYSIIIFVPVLYISVMLRFWSMGVLENIYIQILIYILVIIIEFGIVVFVNNIVNSNKFNKANLCLITFANVIIFIIMETCAFTTVLIPISLCVVYIWIVIKRIKLDQFIPFVYSFRYNQKISIDKNTKHLHTKEELNEVDSFTFQRRLQGKVKSSILFTQPREFFSHVSKRYYTETNKKYIYLDDDAVVLGKVNFIDAPFGEGKTFFINQLVSNSIYRCIRIDIDEIGPNDNPIYYIRKKIYKVVSFNHRYRIDTRKLSFIVLMMVPIILSSASIWEKLFKHYTSDSEFHFIVFIYTLIILCLYFFTSELLHWLSKYSIEVRELLRDDIKFVLKKYNAITIVIENIDRLETHQIKELTVLLDQLKKDLISNTIILTGDENKINKKLSEDKDSSNCEKFIKKYYSKKITLPEKPQTMQIELIKKVYAETFRNYKHENSLFVYRDSNNVEDELEKFIISNLDVFFPQNLFDALYLYKESNININDIYRDLLRVLQKLSNYDISCFIDNYEYHIVYEDNDFVKILNQLEDIKKGIYNKQNMIGVIQFQYIGLIMHQLSECVSYRTYFEKVLDNISFAECRDIDEVFSILIKELKLYVPEGIIISLEELVRESNKMQSDQLVNKDFDTSEDRNIFNVARDMYNEMGFYWNYQWRADSLSDYEKIKSLYLSDLSKEEKLRIDFKLSDLVKKYREPYFDYYLLTDIVKMYLSKRNYSNEKISVDDIMKYIRLDILNKDSNYSKKIKTTVAYYKNDSLYNPSMSYYTKTFALKDKKIEKRVLNAFYDYYESNGLIDWFDELIKTNRI